MQPRKKPRLMPLSGPDGFQKSSAQQGTKKVSVPKFTSAFDKSNDKPTKPVKAPDSSLDPKLRSAVASHSAIAVSESTRGRASSSGASKLPTEATSSRRDPVRAYKDIPLRKTSVFYQGPILGAGDSVLAAPQVSLKKLQAPELASIFPENKIATGKSIKHVMSPPRLQVNAARTKHNLTLSTTSIAIATDLSTDGGNAELASILLHDQHREMLQGDADGSEARRGLNFSPRKKRYGQQGPQFVRNGLAARASQVLSRAHTSLALWQKEMEIQVSPDDSLYSRLKPDIRMNIVKIIHASIQSPAKSSNQHLPCFGIALCRLHLCPSSASHLRSDFPFCYAGSRTLVRVLFSFSSHTSSPHSIVRKTPSFVCGAEILAWKPWYEVKMPTFSNPRHLAGAESETGTDSDNRPVAPPPMPMPASFPMPLTLSSPGLGTQSEMPIADTLLICTRFLFPR